MKSVCLLIWSMFEILFYIVYFTDEQGCIKLQFLLMDFGFGLS